jgi:energy-coupling factor transporter ATP-binding protein EcfA2
VLLERVDVWHEDVRGQPVKIVHELTLSIAPRERIALVGTNGAGKTSLLLALVGALPFAGRAVIAGEPLDRRSLESLRRRMGFVFSDPRDQLFCTSVFDEVAYGPRLRNVGQAELEQRVTGALSAVGLLGLEHRDPAALSLGEQRRLAIATILSYEAALVLVDEPTASLDPRARQAVLEALAALDATVIFATHDLDAARELKARAVVLAAGRLLADGPAERVFADPELMQKAALAPLPRP